MFQESKKFSNVSTAQTFDLVIGGRYLAIVSATFGGGTVKITALAGDGSTYVPIQQAFDAPDGTGGTIEDLEIASFAENGAKLLDLPPGAYKVDITTATAVYVTITRVPLA